VSCIIFGKIFQVVARRPHDQITLSRLRSQEKKRAKPQARSIERRPGLQARKVRQRALRRRAFSHSRQARKSFKRIVASLSEPPSTSSSRDLLAAPLPPADAFPTLGQAFPPAVSASRKKASPRPSGCPPRQASHTRVSGWKLRPTSPAHAASCALEHPPQTD
jgi:hypothetical protein